MLRSGKKLFSKDDILIAIHDVDENIHQGDKVTVFDVCPTCLGLMIDDHSIHYTDENFEKYSNEKFVRVNPDMVDKTKIVNTFRDILSLIAINTVAGEVPAESLVKALKYNMVMMGIEKEVLRPLNRPPE